MLRIRRGGQRIEERVPRSLARERGKRKSETREVKTLKETAVASYNLIRSSHSQKKGVTEKGPAARSSSQEKHHTRTHTDTCTRKAGLRSKNRKSGARAIENPKPNISLHGEKIWGNPLRRTPERRGNVVCGRKGI